MIKKHVGYLLRGHPRDRTYYEDFLQDAYFAVIKAVDSVKWEKVTPDWNFGRVLWPRMLDLRKNYNKLFHKIDIEISTFEINSCADIGFYAHGIAGRKEPWGEDLPSFPTTTTVDWNYYIPYTEQLADEKDEFFKSLSSEEKSILYCRSQGNTLLDTAKKLGFPYSRVQKAVVQCKKKASEIFEVAYS